MDEHRLLTRAARIGMAQQSAADGRTPLAYARGSDRNGAAVGGRWTNTACLRARLGSAQSAANGRTPLAYARGSDRRGRGVMDERRLLTRAARIAWTAGHVMSVFPGFLKRGLDCRKRQQQR